MSFVQTSDGSLARDLWPSGIGVRAGDQRSANELQEWELLPRTQWRFWEWARVESIPENQVRDYTRRNRLVQNRGNGYPEPVVVRLHGFVHRLELRPYGDWDCLEANAVKATQTLILQSGGFAEPFLAQQTTLRNMRWFIMNSFGDQFLTPDLDLHGDRIMLRRRVFTKARAGQLPLSAPYDGRSQQAEAVAKKWVASRPLEIGEVTANGSVVRAPHWAIAEGDFVEVAITADIFKVQGTPRVSFKLEQVILLRAAAEIDQIVAPPVDVEDLPVDTGVQIAEEGEGDVEGANAQDAGMLAAGSE